MLHAHFLSTFYWLLAAWISIWMPSKKGALPNKIYMYLICVSINHVLSSKLYSTRFSQVSEQLYAWIVLYTYSSTESKWTIVNFTNFNRKNFECFNIFSFEFICWFICNRENLWDNFSHTHFKFVLKQLLTVQKILKWKTTNRTFAKVNFLLNNLFLNLIRMIVIRLYTDIFFPHRWLQLFNRTSLARAIRMNVSRVMNHLLLTSSIVYTMWDPYQRHSQNLPLLMRHSSFSPYTGSHHYTRTQSYTK